MKLLVAFALIGLVAGGVLELDYHNKVGIPLAASIRAAEEAQSIDGSRIVGGTPTGLGDYAFLGGLVITLTTGQNSVCGSSLLSPTRSVTAAHCWNTLFSQAQSFTVVLGSTTLFFGGTRVTTRDVETHARWSGLLPVYDIAIISFPPISYNNHIGHIPIATGSDLFVGTTAWAAGFGLTRDGGSITTNQFQSHVSVEVVPNSVCTGVYGILNVRDSTLCTATTGGRGTCGGDSGGPLVANGMLIGITSFGHTDGCEIGYPAGFTRVSSFADWIQARM